MAAPGAAPSAQGRPVRAVVVDDSALMRRMIKSALEAETGIEAVGLAENVGAARDLIRRLDPDVVTLDVEMPGMNGLEFLEKIMQLRPMPVVMVSSHTGEGAEISLAALQMGAVDVVEKPNGPDPLG
ncbi:MAG: response regulator, partial [Pseudomonadota bacterium]